MAQHDYNIANQTAPNFRSDLNNNLFAIVSQNSGTTAPSNTFANMMWYDTTNNILKMRNEADSAWISLFTLDQSGNLANITNSTGIDAKSVSGTAGTSGNLAEWNSDGDLIDGGAKPVLGEFIETGGGSAPYYGARAWVVTESSAFVDGENIASTIAGGGSMRCTFTTAMPNADYCIVASSKGLGTFTRYDIITAQTSTYFDITQGAGTSSRLFAAVFA